MMSRRAVTEIIADSRRIVSDSGVQELKPLHMNGAVEWVSIRGRDRRNPILLVLHGGPGSPTMPAAYTFQNPWEDYFTVVEWDQRGAGKTYAANDPQALASTITFDAIVHDTETLIQYLRQTYGKQKVFLLGHSWGSAVGLTIAQRDPQWLYAYIGVGQMIDAERSEAEGFAFALAEARAHHNEQAVHELQSIAPYPGPGPMTRARIDMQRKWLQYYGGLSWGRTDFAYDANAWLLSPDYTPRDLDLVDSGSTYSLAHLLPTVMNLDFEQVTTLHCPVFLFEGRHDYSVSHTLPAAWLARLHAPAKQLVWFENSAHMPMQEEPGRFLYHLVTDVRPIAVAARDVPPEDRRGAGSPPTAAATGAATAGF